MCDVAEDQKRLAERIELKQPIEGTIGDVAVQIVELSLLNCRVEHYGRLTMGSNASLHFQWRGEKIKLKGKVARTEMRPIGGKPGYSSAVQFATSLEDSPEPLQRVVRSLVQMLGAPDLAPPPAPPHPASSSKPAATKPAPSPKFSPSKSPQPPKAAPSSRTAPLPKAAPPPAPAKPKAAPPPPPPPPLPEPAPFLRDFDEEDEIEEIEASAEILPVTYVQCVLTAGKWTKKRVDDPKQPREGFTMIDPGDDAEVDQFCKTYEVADPETRRMIRVSFEVGIAQKRHG
jgi:hypothetical protein